MTKEYIVLVVRRGADGVGPGLPRAVESLVDQGEVVGVDRHAAVGVAGPSDVIGRAWQAGVGEDRGQTGLDAVLREEGDIRERGIQGPETLCDVVGRRGLAAAVAAKWVRVVVNVQTGRSAERIDQEAWAARGRAGGGSFGGGGGSGCCGGGTDGYCNWGLDDDGDMARSACCQGCGSGGSSNVWDSSRRGE